MQRLSNKIVYFDANIFIYAVETNETMSPYFTIVSHLFELAVTHNIAAMTSELTLAEVLVGAYNTNKQALVQLYEDLISTKDDLTVYPVDRQILTSAALLRSQRKTALADAIHVATALHYKADFFITQDKRLQVIGSVKKLLLDDLSNA